jgi:AAA domain
VHRLSPCYTLTLLPEGTGKSFVGALCAKILLQSGPSAIEIPPFSASAFLSSAFSASSSTKVLVNCYTNHALDQFLEDLIKIGIPKDEIVRIGGKANQNTAELSLQSLGKSSGYRLSQFGWDVVEELREQRDYLCESLQSAYWAATAQHNQVMQHIKAYHHEYAAAFYVPESTGSATIVGKGGRAIGPNYLLDRWLQGQDAGPFKNEPHIQASEDIWKMERPARLSRLETWKRAAAKKGIDKMLRIGEMYNQCVTDLGSMYRKREASVLRNRRIIGCTTTAAAMYRLELCFINFSLC